MTTMTPARQWKETVKGWFEYADHSVAAYVRCTRKNYWEAGVTPLRGKGGWRPWGCRKKKDAFDTVEQELQALEASLETEAMTDKMDLIYADGHAAALRVGKYAGINPVPDCPHAEHTPEHDRWMDGFSDGTEDLIAWQRGEL